MGNEDGREGEIERGASEVEAIARGDDEGDDAARDAEGFHAFHGAGKGGFGSAGGEGDGGGLGDSGEEFAKWDAGEKSDG